MLSRSVRLPRCRLVVLCPEEGRTSGPPRGVHEDLQVPTCGDRALERGFQPSTIDARRAGGTRADVNDTLSRHGARVLSKKDEGAHEAVIESGTPDNIL